MGELCLWRTNYMKSAILRSLTVIFCVRWLVGFDAPLDSLFHLGILFKYFAHGFFFGWVWWVSERPRSGSRGSGAGEAQPSVMGSKRLEALVTRINEWSNRLTNEVTNHRTNEPTNQRSGHIEPTTNVCVRWVRTVCYIQSVSYYAVVSRTPRNGDWNRECSQQCRICFSPTSSPFYSKDTDSAAASSYFRDWSFKPPFVAVCHVHRHKQ